MKTASRKNITFNLPEALLRRFRVYAATKNQSMTSLVAEAIRRMIDEDSKAAGARMRLIDRMRNAPDRGTGGVISWTRDEIHEH